MKTKTKIVATSYRLIFALRVDHPELRGPTYPVVPAGRHIITTWQYSCRADAVRVYDAIVSGDPEFSWGSEYIDQVEVVSVDLSRSSSPRVVRRRLERRDRGQPWLDLDGKAATRAA